MPVGCTHGAGGLPPLEAGLGDTPPPPPLHLWGLELTCLSATLGVGGISFPCWLGKHEAGTPTSPLSNFYFICMGRHVRRGGWSSREHFCPCSEEFLSPCYSQKGPKRHPACHRLLHQHCTLLGRHSSLFGALPPLPLQTFLTSLFPPSMAMPGCGPVTVGKGIVHSGRHAFLPAIPLRRLIFRLPHPHQLRNPKTFLPLPPRPLPPGRTNQPKSRRLETLQLVTIPEGFPQNKN